MEKDENERAHDEIEKLVAADLISDWTEPSTRGDLRNFAIRMDSQFGKLERRFDKIDGRFDKMDARFDKMSSENTHNTNQLLRRNTAQVLSIAISAVGVVVALVANIIS